MSQSNKNGSRDARSGEGATTARLAQADDGTARDGGAPTLRGRVAWIVTDGKAGHRAQAEGVAQALGVSVVEKVVAPTGWRRWLSPWRGISSADISRPNDAAADESARNAASPLEEMEGSGQTVPVLRPPWPTLAIAVGRLTIPYIRALKRVAGNDCFTVVLQDPRTGTGTAHLIWVPEHDRLRGANVITTPTSAHRFSPAYLDTLRAQTDPKIAALTGPRVSVLVGGPNKAYRYDAEEVARFQGALSSIGAQGASFLISTSRRTPDNLVAAVMDATRDAPRVVYDGVGENPYAMFLAHGTRFIVTADSVNMTGEACATGRPVYVFYPKARPSKYARFHKQLEDRGMTRPLHGEIDIAESWSYPVPYAAEVIAQAIQSRWQKWIRDRSV